MLLFLIYILLTLIMASYYTWLHSLYHTQEENIKLFLSLCIFWPLVILVKLWNIIINRRILP